MGVYRTVVRIHSEPPLSLMRTFRAAAKHSNFTRAAEELRVSQSAVSQQIRQLEKTLGIVLFDRAGPVVRLTDDGRRLAYAVTDGLAIIEEALGKMGARTRDNRLKLRAISSFSFFTLWLMPHLPAFLDEHPEIELDIITTHWVTPPLEASTHLHIDLGPLPDTAELVVGPQTLLAVAHPDIAARVNEPSDLAQVTLLEVVGTDGWRQLLSRFDTVLEPWPHAHTSTTSVHSIELARMGRGVALVQDLLVEDLLAKGELVTVAGMTQPASEHFFLMLPEPSKLNSAESAFVDWLRSFQR